MQVPLELAFRDFAPTEAVRERIRREAAVLERFCDHVTSCRVVVEVPHRRHQQGKLFHVRVDVTVPGREIVVRRDPRERRGHEDLYVAIRDAFDAARRQVQDYVRERRGDVKRHEAPPHGRVAKIFPDEGYGFVQTPDGREVYFHRNAVLDGFAKLRVGGEVRFSEQSGDDGPQATSLQRVGRHHRLE